MAQVHINNIVVKNNPANAVDPLAFDITFECFSQLPGTFDWKIIYIGSPNNSNCDQIIDQFDMDNLAPGVMNFTVESNCPNFSLIPEEEIVGKNQIMQEPPPSSFLFPMKSKSSSGVGTTSETNMMKIFKNRQKMCPCPTFVDTFWLKTPEFSDLRSSGPSTKERPMRTTLFFSRTWK